MKLDVEGSELEVLPDMIYQKSFQNIDGFMVEFHPPKEDQRRYKAVLKLKELMSDFIQFWNLVDTNHQIEYIDHDDESFHLSKFPLPKC